MNSNLISLLTFLPSNNKTGSEEYTQLEPIFNNRNRSSLPSIDTPTSWGILAFPFQGLKRVGGLELVLVQLFREDQ